MSDTSPKVAEKSIREKQGYQADEKFFNDEGLDSRHYWQTQSVPALATTVSMIRLDTKTMHFHCIT